MDTKEKLTRRKVLTGLTVAGAGAVLTGTAQAGDCDDRNLKEQKKKLEDVLEHTELADAKITRVASR